MVSKTPLEDKVVLVTGGTGSLGRVLVRRLLGGEMGRPKRITVFSRDEAKQHYMRLYYKHLAVATEEVIYRNSQDLLTFQIGDVRDYASLAAAVKRSDVVFNTAALKQVPTCEYFPHEAVATNVLGPVNLVRAIRETGAGVEAVIGISTDKACKPINVMGMTKALQERVILQANLDCPGTRFVCVRYGNVLSSRGSVVPLFREQISRGGPVTVTMREMTRFLLTLNQAVDTVFAAMRGAHPGETYVPAVCSAKVVDIARVMMGRKKVKIVYTGIRPGEKVHEILVSEEERFRTEDREGYYVIQSVLPELRLGPLEASALKKEFSSADSLIAGAKLEMLLRPILESPENAEEGFA